MKRRNFIKAAGTSLLSIPFTLNGFQLNASPQSSEFSTGAYNDKILVLINLAGGNDGLNMVIPVDQYANLATHRSNVLIPQADVLTLNTNTGLHPAMTGLHNMYNSGEVAIVQGVGYPNFNRSHFRATDILNTGLNTSGVLATGWLGRYFDTEITNYPTGFPNTNHPDPFALTIGNTVSKTCQGLAGNFSLAIQDPFNLNPLATSLGGPLPTGYYGDLVDHLRTTTTLTNDYGAVIQAAANLGANTGIYPSTNLADQLKTVANLISGGLQTKVYVVTQGGYDTHGNQVDSVDPTIGEHASLLGDLSAAIAAFQADLKAQSLEDKVIGLAYTEFGRRIVSNGSLGTDHGDASPMILFGENVTSGVFGSNPTIPTTASGLEGVSMQYDYRDVYKTILDNWLCSDDTTIQNNILMGSFSEIGATGGPCASVLPIGLLAFEAQAFNRYIGLFWETEPADTLKGFWLQRSEDGVGFEDYKWVEGYTNVSAYHYEDHYVRPNQQYYYRLKIVEDDETTTFSLIRSGIINSAQEDWLMVYPNPAVRSIQVETPSLVGEGQMVITDKNGRIMFQGNWTGGQREILVADYAIGMYNLQIFTNVRTYLKKFLKVGG